MNNSRKSIETVKLKSSKTENQGDKREDKK